LCRRIGPIRSSRTTSERQLTRVPIVASTDKKGWGYAHDNNNHSNNNHNDNHNSNNNEPWGTTYVR